MMFWRAVYPADRTLVRPPVAPPPGECAETAYDVWSMAPAWLTKESLEEYGGKITAFTMRGNAGRRDSSIHSIRVWRNDFPPGSFFDYGTGLYISSPCFTFLQMAQELNLIELIAYGDELCGTYAFDRANERGMHKRKHPLINKEQLARFLEGAVGSPGIKKARVALRYIVDNAASPAETVDEMLLCLPYRLGGYSLRTATMNAKVPMTTSANAVSHLQDCYTDISWPPIHFDIEHQGQFDHLSPSDYNADRARINALRMMGFEVIELTHGQVGDWRAFEEIALHAAKVIGHRIRTENRGLTPERRALRNALRAWNAAYGIPLNHRGGTRNAPSFTSHGTLP